MAAPRHVKPSINNRIGSGDPPQMTGRRVRRRGKVVSLLSTDDPRLAILREAEIDPVTEIAAKYDVTPNAIYEWREDWGHLLEYERLVSNLRAKGELVPASINEFQTAIASSRREYTLTLYRGFTARSVTRTAAGEYVFRPTRTEDGVLWFTHEFVESYRGRHVDYAKCHGGYLLTYPLSCWCHGQMAAADSAERTSVPEIIKALENRFDTRFLDGIELPPGWCFSYKVERFICCSREIVAPAHMVKRVRWRDG